LGFLPTVGTRGDLVTEGQESPHLVVALFRFGDESSQEYGGGSSCGSGVWWRGDLLEVGRRHAPLGKKRRQGGTRGRLIESSDLGGRECGPAVIVARAGGPGLGRGQCGSGLFFRGDCRHLSETLGRPPDRLASRQREGQKPDRVR
jgi:hypothetical protein